MKQILKQMKYILLLILFCTSFAKAQDIKLKIVDLDSKKEIENVLIYSQNKLIKTKPDGTINLNQIDSISVVKENYEDLKLGKNEILKSSLIFLKKYKYLDIEEVVISKINANTYLDSILVAAKRNIEKSKNSVNYSHFKYEFKNNEDFIQYFNGRVSERYPHYHDDSSIKTNYKIDPNTEYIQKMHANSLREKDKKGGIGKEKYFLQSSANHFLTSGYSLYYSLKLRWKINETDYNLKITAGNDQYLKLTFSPKIDDGWKYKGFIIFK